MDTTEIILACPSCGQEGFTVGGLRQHVCKRKQVPAASKFQRGARLTRDEWQMAVTKARRIAEVLNRS
jgi:hypothetical protein